MRLEQGRDSSKGIADFSSGRRLLSQVQEEYETRYTHGVPTFTAFPKLGRKLAQTPRKHRSGRPPTHPSNLCACITTTEPQRTINRSNAAVALSQFQYSPFEITLRIVSLRSTRPLPLASTLTRYCTRIHTDRFAGGNYHSLAFPGST